MRRRVWTGQVCLPLVLCWSFFNAATVKIWSLGSSTPNFQLEAHESKGVNQVDYYPHSDKPYLLTTSDDVGALCQTLL